MESLARPLRRAVEDVQWFVANPALRLLHICTDGDTQRAVLELLARLELAPENRAPMVFLDAAHNRDDDGWSARAFDLREDHDERRTAMAAAGEALPPLGDTPAQGDAVARFAAQLQQVLGAGRGVFEGLSVALITVVVEEPERFAAELLALIGAPGLEAVRWLVVDRDAPTVTSAVRALGAQAVFCDARVDVAARDRELAAMMERSSAAATRPAGPAQAGAAWPRGIVPPPRIGRSEPDPRAVAATLRELGLPEGLASPELARLRPLVFGAARTARLGQHEAAIAQQAAARDLCLHLGLPREAAMMDLLVGGYQLAAQQRTAAAETFRSAATRAEHAGHRDLAAQALMSLAALDLLRGDHAQASAHYSRAAVCAEGAGTPALALECHRMCGVSLSAQGRTAEAVEVWRRGLALIHDGVEARSMARSAVEVARALASAYRAQGGGAQADSLEDWAQTLEDPVDAIEAAQALAAARARTASEQMVGGEAAPQGETAREAG